MEQFPKATASKSFRISNADVAQLVEQPIRKPLESRAQQGFSRG